jgi:predicted ester cyclase
VRERRLRYEALYGVDNHRRITIEGQLAEGDMVATRWTGAGTHQGELLGVPPSGNC